ncbi:MAG: hypothetical protein N3A60_04205 [Thermanaerothrix sp.]|nr:hypothetical protein [Thermanaerothrix sp.]
MAPPEKNNKPKPPLLEISFLVANAAVFGYLIFTSTASWIAVMWAVVFGFVLGFYLFLFKALF